MKRICRMNSDAQRKARARLIREHGEWCAFCGEVERLTVDHIIPLARGGNNEFRNLQLLCDSCNNRKGCKIAPRTRSLVAA